jgi:hypothetical protein
MSDGADGDCADPLIEADRGLLDAYDAATDNRGHAVGTNPDDEHGRDRPGNEKAPPERGFL